MKPFTILTNDMVEIVSYGPEGQGRSLHSSLQLPVKRVKRGRGIISSGSAVSSTYSLMTLQESTFKARRLHAIMQSYSALLKLIQNCTN